MKYKNKIGFFTGNRAEYGILSNVMKEIGKIAEFELMTFVGGAHLAHQFGGTIQEIQSDGFEITERLDFLLASDSEDALVKSMGLALIDAFRAFRLHKPDFLFVLGDRYETFSICQAAHIAKIPIGHIHGGELTYGALDDAFRHAITKMAHFHFTSTEEYRKRVIQLGEEPSRVFCVGAPSIDGISANNLSDTRELSDIIGFDLTEPYYVLTYHPVTLDPNFGLAGLDNLLQILRCQDTHKIVITAPNVDYANAKIYQSLEKFVAEDTAKRKFFSSLGRVNYFNLLAGCDAVLGNSSSGLIEAPSFSVPTINIGKRQQGRVSGDTVIHVTETTESIFEGIKRLSDPDFRARLRKSFNPYGEGGSSKQIAKIVKNIDLNNVVNKGFYDLTFNEV